MAKSTVKVTGLKVDIQSGTTNVLYASWSFSSKKYNTLDKFKVVWVYTVSGTGKWFEGSSSEVAKSSSSSYLTATYSIPENASKVKLTVTPVAKKKAKWTGKSTSITYNVTNNPPADPPTPSITIEKYSLTAIVEGITDKLTDQIAFEIYKENTRIATGTSSVSTGRAKFTCSVSSHIGGKFRARCRAINVVGTAKEYSVNWSGYSSEETTIPAGVTGVKCTVDNDQIVKVSWNASNSAEEYEVQCATNKLYFDSSSEVKNATSTTTYAYISGLETGKEWFFRVRAKNNKGESGWSSVVSVLVGTDPSAPTTWSLCSSAIIGEDPVILYWTHNTEDGSKQKSAQIEVTIDGTTNTYTYTNAADEDDDEYVYSYTLNVSSYSEGATILWRVRTKGVTGVYSEWSTQRTIYLYAPPSVSLDYLDVLETFPYTIGITAGPSTQTALVYHLSILTEESYETEDEFGNSMYVNAGAEVYSEIYMAQGNAYIFELTPGKITLENNQRYSIKVTASMNSGLDTEASGSFEVSWSDESFEPTAGVEIDMETLAAYICPVCEDEDEELLEGVTLSVYRREYDGSFTEIATDITNDGVTTVVDPHPSLDYARYRIVARSTTTGSMAYDDIPGIEVGETSIVIQWDEEWSDFDFVDDESMIFDIPPTTGSMIKLPYNIDTSESHDPDVSLIEYIGRKNPVSYYGTQKGEKGNWSAEIPKSDKETIYALRRLSVWPGDVYVREPSGVGYWAHVIVNMSMKHKELTVPVSLTITRVEGGI